jgi:hypothetical protein
LLVCLLVTELGGLEEDVPLSQGDGGRQAWGERALLHYGRGFSKTEESGDVYGMFDMARAVVRHDTSAFPSRDQLLCLSVCFFCFCLVGLFLLA